MVNDNKNCQDVIVSSLNAIIAHCELFKFEVSNMSKIKKYCLKCSSIVEYDIDMDNIDYIEHRLYHEGLTNLKFRWLYKQHEMNNTDSDNKFDIDCMNKSLEYAITNINKTG